MRVVLGWCLGGVGVALGLCWAYRRSRWVNWGSRLVSKAFKIPTCWYQQHKSLALGVLPTANPQHEQFHVAVEFRL